MYKRLLGLLLTISLSLVLCHSAFAVKPIYSGGKTRAAIRGYDTVAYFTENEAIQGTRKYALKYRGAVWYFSSEENKKLFAANPRKYVPQYGGYCAYSVARDSIASTLSLIHI